MKPSVAPKDLNKAKVAVSFASYQTQKDYITPGNKRHKNKDIQYWGDGDNNYPRFLRLLYDNSSTHSSIIDGKLDFISGVDIVSKAGKNKKLNDFIGKINSHYDTLYEFYRKIVLDDLIYGGWACEMVTNRAGGIMEINYVDISTLRYNELGDKIKKAEKAEDWFTKGISVKVVEYPIYDPNNPIKGASIFLYSGLSTRTSIQGRPIEGL